MKKIVDDLPRRHCMVVYALYPLGETRVQREAEALVDAGFEVDVICLRARSRKEAAQETVNGVCVYRVPFGRRKRESFLRLLLDYLIFFLFAMFALTYRHLVQHYHTIQVHNLPDFLVFAAWLPKLMGVPIILDLHDLMPEFYASRRENRNMNSLGVRLVTWQEKISCNFADHVITVTELWRQALIKRGIPSEKVSVVMNVADDRIFQHKPTTGIATNGQFRLIYHGLQAERYGLDLILQAAAQIKDKIPNLRILMHGGGEYHATLRKIADELELDGYVDFSTSFVDVTELPALINTADVGIVPYRRDIFTDGILPTKLMEYVALHIPVIAARTPIIEMYFDETMVQFFTPENVDELAACILKLYQEPSRRVALAQGADKFNEQYSWRKLSTEYVNLITTLN